MNDNKNNNYTSATKEQYQLPVAPSFAFVDHKFGMTPHR
jgi:hypothetical protein